MFLLNSRQGSCAAGDAMKHRQPLLRTYGHCFAEFLNEGSPDHLGTITPAHLSWFAVRAARQEIVRRFSGKQLRLQRLGLAAALSRNTSTLADSRICLRVPPSVLRRISHMSWQYLLFRSALQTT